MDWARILEPYFLDYPPGIRKLLIDDIVSRFPSAPTLQTQQAIMRQIPALVNSLKDRFIQTSIDAGVTMKEEDLMPFSYIDLPVDLSQSFTADICDSSRIINMTPISVNFTYDLIKGLWIFFRLNNPISLEKYPNVEHLDLDISETEIERYSSLYFKLERVFLEFIDLNRGSLVFVAGDDIIILVKDGDFFDFNENKGKGRLLTDILGIPAGYNFIFTIDCLD